MVRLAIAISHPIQYHAPLYGYLARDSRFDLHVFYMSDRGARAYFEPFAQTMVSFDNPILAGYEHTFLSRGEPQSWLAKKTEMMQFGLRDALAKWKPEAVYFHGYTNPAFLRAMSWCRANGVAVWMRGENEDVLPRPPWRNVAREAFLRRLIPKIDAFLYIGRENHDFFIRRGVSPSKLFYVPYSVDNHYFAGGIDETERERIRNVLRERYALASEARVFIYTHKFRDTMRPLDAVQGFGRASSRFTRPAALIMCGSGELKAAIEQMASSYANARVILPGFLKQSELREHLLGSDVMINPAIEPWGCSVNEGIASALAQISSSMVVGWPDMVREKNGLVYEAGDLDALANDIAKLAAISDDELRAMQNESLRLAREELSFAKCADGLADAAAATVKR